MSSDAGNKRCHWDLLVFSAVNFFPRSNGAAVVPLQITGPPLRISCAGTAPVEMHSRTSIVAWILTVLGDFVGFETQRAHLLCKIYVAKVPGATAGPEVCGLWAR